MAYEDVLSLHADVTTAIGGFNKKLGKKNPDKIEGYFLGVETKPDAKKKSGFNNIYYFKTSEGNVAVWGKTDLDNKIKGAKLGLMTLIQFTGMRDTPNGEMYVFSVKQDKTNSTDVSSIKTESSDSSYESSYSDNDEDDTAAEESVPPRPTAPYKPATVSSESQRRTQELLKRSNVR